MFIPAGGTEGKSFTGIQFMSSWEEIWSDMFAVQYLSCLSDFSGNKH